MNDRRDRRRRERAHRKLVRDLDDLARLTPGGQADRPIDVVSPAIIEPMVQRRRCPLCDGGLHLVEHGAEVHAGQSLRTVLVRCARCAVERTLFFRVAPPRTH